MPKPDALEMYTGVGGEGGGGVGEWDVGAVDVDAGLTMTFEAWRAASMAADRNAERIAHDWYVHDEMHCVPE